ncbi:predicted protein [Nematostella vectensis]|uniref:NACHT domain-containing protein n=1 Tax=Nematostella vectensis TaxID=45351 RepID=A7S460_NEMVE|nr:predicted protein [Nematostella vectensis]|eukprot:XP_001633587.1 predicted protein [Nematostella vectensis]
MANIFPLTKESDNFAKLGRLLIDGGTKALCSVLDGSIHPPGDLAVALYNNKTLLHNLWKPPTPRPRNWRKVLNDDQWYQLFPQPSLLPPSSESFDITLLTILLRNICPTLTAPATGWDALPAPTDKSKEGMIARIKYYRNKVYAHIHEAACDDDTFEKFWDPITAALVALGVNQDEIDELKKRPGSTECLKTLEQWCKTDIQQFEQLNKNVLALKRKVSKQGKKFNKKLKGVSQQVQQALNQRASSSNPDQDADHQKEAIKKLLTSLVFEYTEGSVSLITPLPWMEALSKHTLQHLFKNLLIAEDGSFVKLCDLFESDNTKKRILLEGNPGIGKTTVSKKLVNSWASHWQGHSERASDDIPPENIFPPETEIVLLVVCHDLENPNDWKDVLRQSLPEDLSDSAKDIILSYISDNKERVAIVIDGYDELPASSTKAFDKIFNSKVLQNSYVIVTSRPNTIKPDMRGFFRKLEIKGFDDLEVKEFISSYFTKSREASKRLKDRVKKDRRLADFVRNPLFLAMICVVFEDSEDRIKDDLTREDLYNEIVYCLTKRYCKRRNDDDVEGNRIKLRFNGMYLQLGKCAFKGLLKGELSADTAEDLALATQIGFLVKNCPRRQIRSQITLSFFHKSIQEFFAALYIADCLGKGVSGEESHLSLYCLSWRHFYLVFKFDIIALIDKQEIAGAAINIVKNLQKNRFYFHLICECLFICKDLMDKERILQDIRDNLRSNTVNFSCDDGLHINIDRALDGLCLLLGQPEIEATGIERLNLWHLSEFQNSFAKIAFELKNNSSLRTLIISSGAKNGLITESQAITGFVEVVMLFRRRMSSLDGRRRAASSLK